MMAPTRTSYYVSQDVADGGEVLPTWSIYSEQWELDSWEAGDPIDGSQRFVSTHESEAAADAEADRLYRAEHA